MSLHALYTAPVLWGNTHILNLIRLLDAREQLRQERIAKEELVQVRNLPDLRS